MNRSTGRTDPQKDFDAKFPEDDEGHGDYGSAKWLTEPDEIEAAQLYKDADRLFNSKGVIIGSGLNGFIRYHGDGHTMMFAPPGSGKGIGFVIPNCIAHPGSMLIIDPKGENAAVTAQNRIDQGHNVYVLDPFGVSGKDKASYNPLAWLYSSEHQHFMADLAAIAEALIVPEPSEDAAHWYQLALNMIEGIILDLIFHVRDKYATLMDVFNSAFAEKEAFEKIWTDLADSSGDNAEPFLLSRIHAAGNWYFSISEKEQQITRSTVQKNLRFLKNFVMEDCTKGPGFDMRNFKHGRMTIYLCLPFEYLEMHKAWLRVMLTMALLATLRQPGKPTYRVLFLLDELYAGIGRLDLIARAVPSIRGAGGRFAFIMQSLSQLKSMYPTVWEDFFAAAGASIFCNVNDRETAEYVSARLGTKTMNTGSKLPGEASTAARPLRTLDEVTRFPKSLQIVLLQNHYPARCKIIDCWSDPRINGYLEANPMHAEAEE